MSLKPRTTILGLLTVGAMSLGLAACAPQGDPAPGDAGQSSAEGCAPSGPASDSVEITGDFGGELSWAFTTALDVETVQRTVTIEGDGGAGAADGQTVNAFYTLFDGANGETILSSQEVQAVSAPLVNDVELYNSGFIAAIDCATPGSRIVAVMPAVEAFGESTSILGLADEAPLVLVLDVESVEDTVIPEVPQGQSVERDGSLSAPAIDLSGAVPAVTLPESAPPSEFQLEVLVPGDGEVVPAGATVTVDYHGVSWDTGTVFDSSYTRGAPATFSTEGVIAGFRDAIVGQPVGTTLVATMPPDMAYGPASSGHQLGGQTLVFVVHIVSID